MPKAVDALKRIAESQSRFVSRGDKSGTHVLEQALWKQAGVEPKGAWYIESGQGMGQTLGIANDRRAYTLTDRGTWLAFQKRVSLPILVEKDKPLLNIYSVMEVNPANGPAREHGRRQGLRRLHGWRRRPRPSSGPSAWTSSASRSSSPSRASGRRPLGRRSAHLWSLMGGDVEAIRLLAHGGPGVWRITLLSLQVSGVATLLSLGRRRAVGTVLALARFPGRGFSSAS